MKGSIQEYYEKLISLQSDSIKNILKETGLNNWDILSSGLSDKEREYIFNGYSNGTTLRADLFFRNIVKKTRLKELLHNNNVKDITSSIPCDNMSEEGDNLALFEELRSTLSVRAINILSANGIYKFEDFYRFISSENNNFSSLHNCGRKTVVELESIAIALRKNNGSTEKKESTKVDEKITFVNKKIEELNLSVRTKNCLKYAKITTLEELVRCSERDIFKTKNLGKKSLDELCELLSILGLHFGMTSEEYQLTEPPKIDYSIDNSSVDSILYYVYSRIVGPIFEGDEDYPQIIDAKQFREEYGHFPMLRLFYDFLGTLTNWEREVFEMHWGLFEQNNVVLPPMSFGDISEKQYLTAERIRQIFEKAEKRLKIFTQRLFKHHDWASYTLNNEPVSVIPLKKTIERIHPHPNIELPQKGVAIYCAMLQLGGMTPYWIDVEQKGLTNSYANNGKITPDFFVDNQLSKFDYNKAVREVYRLQRIKKNESIKITISSYFIENEIYWKRNIIPLKFEKEELQKLLIKLFQLFFDIQVEDNYILLKANKVDYGELLYEILKKAGTRIYRDELFERLNELCLEKGFICNFNDSSQITTFLTRDPRIIPYGKSGFWGLKEWGELTGSIRDISMGLMRKSKVPMQIEELARDVLKHRPDSAMDNVTTIIRQSVYMGELLLFFDDYVGLPDKKYDDKFIIYPQNFQEWIDTFRDFVITNRRFPYSGQLGYEGYLYRWHYKAGQLTELSADEILQFDALEKELSHYPHNATEYNFLHNCELYKRFVERNNRKLKAEDDSTLCNWFYAASRDYSTYNDNRNKYFSQLLNFLSTKLY